MSDKEEILGTSEAGGSSGGKFHFLQANRDPQSNWEVDLAKKLEEYLLKICSGEISPDQDHVQHSVNFAEAALLLQGSIQVYSRKVEYLYSLVLHALEFLSQKRQDQQENASIQPDGTGPSAVVDEEDEVFLGLDDVPEEPKNCLDNGLNKDDTSNHFVKPPANLLVLEGDCLDTSGDAGELESYLLATCNFYGDFLLLDPCDAGAVHNFLKSNAVGKEHNVPHRGSSVRSKSRHSFFPSPTGRSGGTAHKSGLGKNLGVNLNQDSENNCPFEVNNDNLWPGSHVDHNIPEYDMCHEEEPTGCSDFRNDSDNDDDDDPWKPLNPHEPGNLKVKPFKKGKRFVRQVIHATKRNTLASQFPIAKLVGTISPEFEELEAQFHAMENLRAPQSPPLFEKLRQSLVFGEKETSDAFGDPEDEDGGENDLPDFEQAEFDMPHSTYDMETEVPLPPEKEIDISANFDGAEAFSQGDPDSHTSLEDLCRSHMDALLASIAETEKQTELAARVSTWKQRIEHTLEEQETQPPFDIHLYGDTILEKLSTEAESGGSMSFTDVVKGQPKHDVARTFSALMQLVNNGDVDLQRVQSNGELVCYTAANPFHVRLLRHGRRREEIQIRSSKKRVKSPLRKGCNKVNPSTPKAASPVKSSHQNGRFSVKLGKNSVMKCTPEGKRRRRSRLMEPVDFQSAV